MQITVSLTHTPYLTHTFYINYPELFITYSCNLWIAFISTIVSCLPPHVEIFLHLTWVKSFFCISKTHICYFICVFVHGTDIKPRLCVLLLARIRINNSFQSWPSNIIWSSNYDSASIKVTITVFSDECSCCRVCSRKTPTWTSTGWAK